MPSITAARTIRFPENPTDGTWWRLKGGGVGDFFLLLNGSGKNINDGFQSSAATYAVANDGVNMLFVYSAAQDEWVIASDRVPVISRRMRYHATDANTVALWHGFGDKTDSSGSGLTLSLGAGTERYADVGGSGLVGFLLDGVTYYKRSVNDAVLNLPGDVTLEFIMRCAVQPTGLDTGTIVGYGAPGETGGNDNVLWQAGVGDTTIGGAPNVPGMVSSSFFYEQGAGVNVEKTSLTLRPMHQAHHIAWVRSGTTLTEYVDGFPLAPNTGLTIGTLGGTPAQFVTIGATKDVANFFIGVVASIKISNIARSAGYILKDAIRTLGAGIGITDASTVAV